MSPILLYFPTRNILAGGTSSTELRSILGFLVANCGLAHVVPIRFLCERHRPDVLCNTRRCVKDLLVGILKADLRVATGIR